LRVRLTTLRISCGRNGRPSEFYGPPAGTSGSLSVELKRAAPGSCMRGLGGGFMLRVLVGPILGPSILRESEPRLYVAAQVVVESRR